jgi:hypothetical protein
MVGYERRRRSDFAFCVVRGWPAWSKYFAGWMSEAALLCETNKTNHLILHQNHVNWSNNALHIT